MSGLSDWSYAQKYICKHCRSEQWLPEHPDHGPARVRAGCDTCGSISPHTAIGRDPRWQAVVDAMHGQEADR